MISRLTLIRAAMAATALMELNRRAKEAVMSDPKNPSGVPPGDLGDAIGPSKESDFNRKDTPEIEFDDNEDDDLMDDEGEEY